MREILFKGKRTDNGKWVEGFPFVRKDTQGEIIDCFIIVDSYEQITYGQRYVRSNLNQECFRVYPETVSQFAGLTDKNGKKIFDGNIIRYAPGEEPAIFIGVVKRGEFSPDGLGEHHATNVGFYVKWLNQDGKHVLLRKDIGFWAKFREIEVIGNIHDNPELLEG